MLIAVRLLPKVSCSTRASSAFSSSATWNKCRDSAVSSVVRACNSLSHAHQARSSARIRHAMPQIATILALSRRDSVREKHEQPLLGIRVDTNVSGERRFRMDSRGAATQFWFAARSTNLPIRARARARERRATLLARAKRSTSTTRRSIVFPCGAHSKRYHGARVSSTRHRNPDQIPDVIDANSCSTVPIAWPSECSTWGVAYRERCSRLL